MEKKYDLLSLGEAVVEIFRKEVDVSMSTASDFVGPYPSGAPAITVDTMAKLGARCAYIATVGADEFGDCVINRLSQDGVDVSGIRRLDNVMTGLAFTSYYSNGDRKFIYNFTTAATAYLSPEMIDEKMIMATKWVHISGNVMAFSESARNTVLKVVEIASDNNIGISLDPNIRLEIMDKNQILELLAPVIEKATVLFPSEGELNTIFGIDKTEKAIISQLLERKDRVVVRKEGENGCTVFSNDGTVHVDAYKNVAEVDPTGCGDAFCAGFIYGLLKEWDYNRIGNFANAVGAITATQKGAMEGVNNLDEVMQFCIDRDVHI